MSKGEELNVGEARRMLTLFLGRTFLREMRSVIEWGEPKPKRLRELAALYFDYKKLVEAEVELEMTPEGAYVKKAADTLHEQAEAKKGEKK